MISGSLFLAIFVTNSLFIESKLKSRITKTILMKTKAILLMVFFLGWVTTGWAADHVKGRW